MIEKLIKGLTGMLNICKKNANKVSCVRIVDDLHISFHRCLFNSWQRSSMVFYNKRGYAQVVLLYG